MSFSLFNSKQFVSANNEVSNSTQTFVSALQNDFLIEEAGTYKITVGFQWRHQEIADMHRVIVEVNSVENTDLRAYQFMGGAKDNSLRRVSSSSCYVDLTPGTYDIDMLFNTDKTGKSSYLYYRYIAVERFN